MNSVNGSGFRGLTAETLRTETVVINGLTEKIIGAAIVVHKTLGPGLLESAYEECLAYELSLANIFNAS